MPQPWPSVKVTERSSSTFPQIHIFFLPNIYGLAQTVLTWEAKVVVAVDEAAVVADTAETNWKHKVTPDWGDFIIAAELGQYNGCWCPGQLHGQVINSWEKMQTYLHVSSSLSPKNNSELKGEEYSRVPL